MNNLPQVHCRSLKLFCFILVTYFVDPEETRRAAQRRLQYSKTSICNLPSEHSDGFWSIKSRPFLQSPPCCSWDEGSNDATCSADTPLHPDGGFRGPDYYYSRSGGHACSCTPEQSHDNFHWNPRNCILPAFNATRFCNLLSDRTLMLVGDSTSDQAATVLINTIRASFGNPVPDLPIDKQEIIGCGRRIRFAVSDTLIGEKFGQYNRGKHWLEYARTLNVERDVLLLSVGPHIYSTSNLKRVIQQVIAEHNAQLPQLRLIWRSQYPGGCGLTPLTEYPDDLYWQDYLNSGREIFSYADHRTWDELALSYFSNSSKNRAFLDISPLHLRPDSHVGSMPGAKYPRDCLHLCLPGPLHPFFAQVLLHVLENMGLEN
jgi:hypothetical protein